MVYFYKLWEYLLYVSRVRYVYEMCIYACKRYILVKCVSIGL